MLQHLFHVGCLAAVAALIYVIPFPAVIAVVGVPLLLYALLANRTRRTRVAGATILVTGASSGLGREIALDAADEQYVRRFRREARRSALLY